MLSFRHWVNKLINEHALSAFNFQVQTPIDSSMNGEYQWTHDPNFRGVQIQKIDRNYILPLLTIPFLTDCLSNQSGINKLSPAH